MIDKANFNELVKLAMAEQGHQNMRPVIEKELLHADILFALDHESLLDGLTFQGGTSLRLWLSKLEGRDNKGSAFDFTL